MKNKIIVTIGVLLVTVGACILLSAAYLRKVNSQIVFTPVIAQSNQNISKEEVLNPETHTGNAVYLDIPVLNIHNEIIDGYYDSSSQKWTLTKDKVQFATITAPPNDEKGLTFLYGHNRKNVFSSLPKIKPDDYAIITTDNGLVFTYKFVSSKNYSPNDVSIFDYTGKPVLVLQTCVGLFYETRQLFAFDLIKVEEDV